MYQKAHINMFINKLPCTVEINGKGFPWDELDKWFKENTEPMVVEKEDCMGGKYDSEVYGCAHVYDESSNDQILFFKSMDVKQKFIQDFKSYVVKENPINKNGDYVV